jgi:hypothetical protein
MKPARLPGFGAGPRRRGRNERAVDAVAALLRSTGDYDAHRAAYITLARTTAAALDRLEHDDDRSEHVIGTVARVHCHALDALRPAPGASLDALDALTDELAAALRDPTPA